MTQIITLMLMRDLYLTFFKKFLFQGEVNAIKWDPTGALLASCSDDNTAKVIACNLLPGLFGVRNRHVNIPSLHRLQNVYMIQWLHTPNFCCYSFDAFLVSKSFVLFFFFFSLLCFNLSFMD